MFRIFENRFEISVLKIESLKFWKLRIIEMNLKFENFELGFWKLNFKIKNLNF